MREPGWYWVKYYGNWVVAHYGNSFQGSFFTVCGNEDLFFGDAIITEIGDKIELPSKYKE